jgi:hypothetical protein
MCPITLFYFSSVQDDINDAKRPDIWNDTSDLFSDPDLKTKVGIISWINSNANPGSTRPEESIRTIIANIAVDNGRDHIGVIQFAYTKTGNLQVKTKSIYSSGTFGGKTVDITRDHLDEEVRQLTINSDGL